MCHGPDGKAQTAMAKNLNLRDLGSAEVQSQSDADLTNIITNGKGKMPKYYGKLTSVLGDEQPGGCEILMAKQKRSEPKPVHEKLTGWRQRGQATSLRLNQTSQARVSC
jgi:hypothetical protein